MCFISTRRNIKALFSLEKEVNLIELDLLTFLGYFNRGCYINLQQRAHKMAVLQRQYPTHSLALQENLQRFTVLKDSDPVRYVKLTKIQKALHFLSYNRQALLTYWNKISPYVLLIYESVASINMLFKDAHNSSDLLMARDIDNLRRYRRRILSNRLNLELGINKMSKRQINIKINQIYDDALSFQLIADDLYKRIHNEFYYY